MAADVVADDVNLAPFGLTGDVREENDELLRPGVTCRRFSYDFAGGGIQCRKQTERAIALVFKSVTLGSSVRQQHPILAVERLNRRFLIHAEHGRMGRRVQIQANHIGRFGLEVLRNRCCKLGSSSRSALLRFIFPMRSIWGAISLFQWTRSGGNRYFFAKPRSMRALSTSLSVTAKSSVKLLMLGPPTR